MKNVDKRKRWMNHGDLLRSIPTEIKQEILGEKINSKLSKRLEKNLINRFKRHVSPYDETLSHYRRKEHRIVYHDIALSRMGRNMDMSDENQDDIPDEAEDSGSESSGSVEMAGKEHEESSVELSENTNRKHLHGSLKSLTRRFLEMLQSSGQVQVPQAAAQLKVPKPLIHNICNVLLGMGYISRRPKSWFVLKNKKERRKKEYVEADKRHLVKEEAILDVWICRLRRLQNEPNEYRFVTASDIRFYNNHQEEDNSNQQENLQNSEQKSEDEDTRSPFAIHAPRDSLIQKTSPLLEDDDEKEESDRERHHRTPRKHQLFVSSNFKKSTNNNKQRSDGNMIEVYWIPKSDRPARSLTDHPMAKLVVPPPNASTAQADYAVLERDEGASSFF